MSDTIESLRRKIDSAGDLGGVVRTMKALAAANITQYERAVSSLEDYYRAVQWGLGACLAATGAAPTRKPTAVSAGKPKDPPAPTSAPAAPRDSGTPRQIPSPGKAIRRAHFIVFGSDQGLVGQFNQVVADFAVAHARQQAIDTKIWAVGERIEPHLADAGYPPERLFFVPGSVQAITPLITQLLTEIEPHVSGGAAEQVIIFYNRPLTGAQYEPVSQCILPVDDVLHRGDPATHWPSGNLPEVMNERAATLQALIGEYLFVSLFKACAESLASENASRLAAMQGAEKNIRDLLEDLNLSYHHLRQDSIDAELFDVIAGAAATQGQ
jgi:F-type H+-transporting ATPase subunit gamma